MPNTMFANRFPLSLKLKERTVITNGTQKYVIAITSNSSGVAWFCSKTNIRSSTYSFWANVMKDGLSEDKYCCRDCDKELTPDERPCSDKLEKPLVTEQDEEFQISIEVAEEHLKQKRLTRAGPRNLRLLSGLHKLSYLQESSQGNEQVHVKGEM
jgi:hypothetical protein